MLQAMNTGHAGSMTTVHANTPRELLGRLETMVMMGGVELPQRAIREQIVMAIGVPGPAAADRRGPPRRALHHRDPGHGGRHRPAPGHLPPGGHGARAWGAWSRPACGPRSSTSCRSPGWRCLPHLFRNDSEALLGSGRTGERPPPPAGPARPRRGAALGGALRDAGAPSRGGEVSGAVLGALQSSQAEAFVAAVLVGGGSGAGRRRRHHAGAHEAAHAGPDPRRHHGHGRGPRRGRQRVARARASSPR